VLRDRFGHGVSAGPDLRTFHNQDFDFCGCLRCHTHLFTLDHGSILSSDGGRPSELETKYLLLLLFGLGGLAGWAAERQRFVHTGPPPGADIHRKLAAKSRSRSPDMDPSPGLSQHS
jgi:hypothetical protein